MKVEGEKISVYIPRKYVQADIVERLRRLARERDRSVNYLIVEAIIQYLEEKEREATGPRPAEDG